ncbi:MAG: hypothetical protein OXJ37_03605 [Bryobacterales bacterium]|nr:hypothetical protein [Bryobacterales bacterium]MDE0261471.1 hypothetical protein [Bryobacterales bacterium]MDE0621587.1 hypothetical protein [Bryobacterales bacterium]
MNNEKPKRKTVERVKSSYRQTKTKMEEEFPVDVPGETVAERMANLGRAITRTVGVRWVFRPRSRRK